MIRLGFYTENYVVGGSERYLLDLMGGLARHQYEISLISNPNSLFASYLNRHGLGDIPHCSIPILPSYPRFVRRWIANAVRRRDDIEQFSGHKEDTFEVGRKHTTNERMRTITNGLWFSMTILPNLLLLTAQFRAQHMDILHINNGGYPAAETCRLAVIAARWARVPICVMTVHSPAFPYTWFSVLDRTLDRHVTKYINTIITMSQSTADSLQRARNLPSTKIRPMDLGIRLPLSDTIPANSETRAQLGIPANAVVVGMVGRFDWYKGHRYLLEAVRQVRDSGDGDNLWVLFVGMGDELNNMKALAHKLHLSDRIVFTGFYPDALVAMRACDIMTMLSVGYEGQGYVILEAMAQSRPVIATNIRGLREVVVDDGTGLLVPPADSQALADALRQLICDEPLRLSMGEAGRRRFEEHFTLDRMLANTQSLYEELLVRRS